MSARIFTFDSPLPRLIYWDAGFLVHATYPAARYHADCYAFLERLSSSTDTLLISPLWLLTKSSLPSYNVTTDDDFVQVDDLNLFTCNPRILAESLTR
jgi:hypothetical protein